MKVVALRDLFLEMSRQSLRKAWDEPTRFLQHVKDAATWLVLAVKTDPGILIREDWTEPLPPVNTFPPYPVHA